MSSSQRRQSTPIEHIDVLIDGPSTTIDNNNISSQTPPPIPPRKPKKREAPINDSSTTGQGYTSVEPPLPPRKPTNKNDTISIEKSIDIDSLNPSSNNSSNNNAETLQHLQASEAGLPGNFADSSPPPLPPRNPTKRKDFTKYYNTNRLDGLDSNAGPNSKELPKNPPGMSDDNTSKVPMFLRRLDTWVETRHPSMRRYKKAIYIGLILLLIGVVITIICVIVSKGKGESDVGRPGSPLKGSGDGTYYDPSVGTGACGGQSTGDQLVAALNAPQFGVYPNPANSPACGACIQITGPKGSVKVKIVDKCPVCKSGDVDMAPAAFDKIGDQTQGRIPITWTGC